MKIDRESMLAEVEGGEHLQDLERQLGDVGLSLGLRERGTGTLSEWIAGGAEGARDPWDDPVDHLVAGFSAQLVNGREIVVPPAPRRSVGPDLFALFLGQGGRFGSVTRAHLRVFDKSAAPVVTSPVVVDRNPKVSPEEERLWVSIQSELERLT